MTLSREARILIGLLVLAIGAWVWLNFAHHEGTSQTLLNTGAQAAEAPPERTPSVAPTVARDVQIAELPFLVTAPPAETTAVTVTGQEKSPTGGAPTLPPAKRVSVNPFSPIIVKTAPAPANSPSQPVQVVDVPIRQPPGGTAVPTDVATTRQPINAPAPSAQAPATAEVGSFPQALPGGMLPVMPNILTTTVAPNAAPQEAPADLATVAAISVPEAQAAPMGLTGVTSSGGTPQMPTPLPLTSRERAANPAPQKKAPSDLASVAAISVPKAKGSPVTLTGVASSGGTPTMPAPLPLTSRTASRSKPAPPLEAGLTPLSRYLRNHNFRFTGEVLGTVGVGVFRSSLDSAPLVLALGQKLPDTDIVLTNLKGQQAEFTQGDDKQVLILDLRR